MSEKKGPATDGTTELPEYIYVDYGTKQLMVPWKSLLEAIPKLALEQQYAIDAAVHGAQREVRARMRLEREAALSAQQAAERERDEAHRQLQAHTADLIEVNAAIGPGNRARTVAEAIRGFRAEVERMRPVVEAATTYIGAYREGANASVKRELRTRLDDEVRALDAANEGEKLTGHTACRNCAQPMMGHQVIFGGQKLCPTSDVQFFEPARPVKEGAKVTGFCGSKDPLDDEEEDEPAPPKPEAEQLCQRCRLPKAAHFYGSRGEGHEFEPAPPKTENHAPSNAVGTLVEPVSGHVGAVPFGQPKTEGGEGADRRRYESDPGFVRAKECPDCGHTRCGEDCDCNCDAAHAEAEAAYLRNDNDEFRKALSAAWDNVSWVETELATWKSRYCEIERNEVVLRRERDDLRSQLAAAKAYTEKQTAVLAWDGKEIDDLRCHRDRLKAQLAAAKADTKALRTMALRLLNAKDEQRRQADAAEAKNAELEKDLQEAIASQECRKQWMRSQDDVLTLRRMLDAKEHELSALRTANAALESEKQKLTARVAELEDCFNKSQDQVDEALDLIERQRESKGCLESENRELRAREADVARRQKEACAEYFSWNHPLFNGTEGTAGKRVVEATPLVTDEPPAAGKSGWQDDDLQAGGPVPEDPAAILVNALAGGSHGEKPSDRAGCTCTKIAPGVVNPNCPEHGVKQPSERCRHGILREECPAAVCVAEEKKGPQP